MEPNPSSPSIQDELLGWCAAELKQFELLQDATRHHPGERVSAFRLRTPEGRFYVKTHRERAGWELEVHGYEQWARAFGDFAPRLVAVREIEPLAIILSELPGQVLESTPLSPEQQTGAWFAAGRALAPLHQLAVGETFGPCHRDGSSAGIPYSNAVEYVTASFDEWLERGLRIGCLTPADQAVVRAAREQIPAYTGVLPVPCHRDYCPANWLVDSRGAWAGVIDFEFAYWDAPAADFTRYPNWDWLDRPDLVEAFFQGYGRELTRLEEQQRRVAHVQYAFNAIVWGEENDYHIFAAEGRQALARMAGWF